MGPLTLPTSGLACVDARVVICTAEAVAVYQPVLNPFWAAAAARHLHVVTSEMTVLEALVGPEKMG